MLENLRKQGASAFIWVVFAILIGMFVINFGPSSVGAQGGGCGLSGGKRVALKVGKTEIDETGLRLAANLGKYLERRAGDGDQMTRRAMERLIVRELLAGEGERRGLRVSEDLVYDAIKHGKVHFAGQVVDARGLFFTRLKDDDAGDAEAAQPDPDDLYFDYAQFKRVLRNMGISDGAYMKEQTREVLASTMARILMHAVPASREEALSTYITENTRVSFTAVRFDANKYADAMIITDGDLDRYIKGHAAEVTATYVADAWKGKKQVHLRRIFVAKAPLPPAPTVTPQPVNGGNGPAPIPAPPPDPAKAKLAALAAQISSGKRGFTEVAQQTDGSPQFAGRGGDWGWYDEGVFTLPDPALNAAAGALVQGKVSDVIEASDGFYLLMIDDRRDGDIAIDKVQRELALPLAKAAWAKEAARRAAIAAVADAKAKAKPLSELYPGEKTGLAPTGPTTIISDRPVVWGQAGEGSTAPPVPAAPGLPGALPVPGAPALPGAPTPMPAPTSIMEPTTEALAQVGKVAPPTVERHDGIVRSGDATPIGESNELVRALFDELSTGELSPRIYEVRGSVVDPLPRYALVQLSDKKLADVKEFDKQADRLVDRLAMTRGYQLFAEWLRERCSSMATAGKLKPTYAYLQTYDDQGRKQPITYQPCESLALPQ